MSSLKILGLTDNYYRHIPSSIGKLTNLDSLYLSGIGNGILNVPEALGNLKKLKNLDLTNCNLTEVPEWIREMPNIQLLNLTSNKIKQLPKWFCELTNLNTLYLSRNLLQEYPEVLEGMNVLELHIDEM